MRPSGPSRPIGMPSVEEFERAFPGEWLAIEVHREDEDGSPVEGELLYHGLDREKAYSTIGTTPRTVYVIHNVPLRPCVHVGLL